MAGLIQQTKLVEAEKILKALSARKECCMPVMENISAIKRIRRGR